MRKASQLLLARAGLLVVVPLIAGCYIQPEQPPPAYARPPATGGPPSSGVAPAGNLSGQWFVTEVVPSSQPFAGTWTSTWDMTDAGGQLSAAGTWSNGGPHSRFAGWVRGGVVHIDRTDDNGFRGIFDGGLSPDGNAMSGEGHNDPTSPGGNAATYTWTAQRISAGFATVSTAGASTLSDRTRH